MQTVNTGEVDFTQNKVDEQKDHCLSAGRILCGGLPTERISCKNTGEMFSRLQYIILAGCTLLAAIIFAIVEFRASTSSRQTVVANSNLPDQSERGLVPPGSESVPRIPTKPITLQNSTSIITNGNEADEKIIDAVVEKFASSIKAGDSAAFIDVMYAPVLEALGGRKKVSEDLKDVMAGMKEQQIVRSWKVNKPYLYVAGKSHKYAVIPYEVKINFSGKIITQTSYELGIKTAGSGWQFVGGDELNPELYDKFFPDFPKDVNLPEVEQHEEN